ncbi:MAG: helicase-related protein [Thermoplasmata archaeon]|nr:helicase-related protein [Thermoplasmata archaeon]
MTFVSHPRIAPDTVEERGYQTRMVEQCVRANTLLILPTGLGKTVVAARLAAKYLDRGKVLVLAPTKPLVDQHSEAFSKFIVGADVVVLNGLMKDTKRAGIVESGDIVVSTPQTVANDLEAGRYDLSAFSLVIYDEAHRGRGDYAYVKVATYVKKGTRSVGMTASPGSSTDRIEEVCINLNLRRIDIRSENDPDVSPFIHDTYVNRIEVDLPQDIMDISALLKVMLDHFYSEMCGLGLANPRIQPSKGYLISIGNGLQQKVADTGGNGVMFKGLTLGKVCIQLLEAVSKVESEGVTVLRRYLDRLEAESKQERGGKAARTIVGRQEYSAVRIILDRTNVEHPKVSRVMSLVSRALSSNPGSKVLVFAQFRDTCEMLVDKISGIPGARVSMLVGQSNGGLKQRDQIAMLDGFRRGDSNVLVSTSVGEEGLDVSNTDAVIFYEPVPSEIRTIQRRGRTGRRSDGEVYVLIARGSVDEAFERSSIRKEQDMRENLERLSERLSRGMSLGDGGQTRLDGFDPPS